MTAPMGVRTYASKLTGSYLLHRKILHEVGYPSRVFPTIDRDFEDLQAWCNKQFGYKHWYNCGWDIFFSKEEFAIMFDLRWTNGQ